MNCPTSAGASPASASAAPTASLPSGIASSTKRRMRAPVPQDEMSSRAGSTTPRRVVMALCCHTFAGQPGVVVVVA